MSPGDRMRDNDTSRPFRTYAGTLDGGHHASDRMVRHLPERVLRQYGYVQTVLMAPTDIELLAADDVA